MGCMSYYLTFIANVDFNPEGTVGKDDAKIAEAYHKSISRIQLRAVINLLIWLRMISFLNMFTKTRIFIFMLI